MSQYFRNTCAIIAIWLAAALSHAQSFNAKVIGVTDGDTITVLQDNQQIKIRLNGIDAPESSQAFGSRSKQVLSDMVFGKIVTVLVSDVDRYGCSIGEITVAWGINPMRNSL